MILLQRLLDLFNLDIPMGRLRYFLTYLVYGLLLCPLILLLSPNILMYEGEETLAGLMTSGYFESSETLIYILLSGILGYTFEFFLDAKRWFDIIGNKKTAIIIASVCIVVGLYMEFFVPLNGNEISIIYTLFIFGLFIFLCVKKGKISQKEQLKEENSDNEINLEN